MFKVSSEARIMYDHDLALHFRNTRVVTFPRKIFDSLCIDVKRMIGKVG